MGSPAGLGGGVLGQVERKEGVCQAGEQREQGPGGRSEQADGTPVRGLAWS